jgi:hypothetical protein
LKGYANGRTKINGFCCNGKEKLGLFALSKKNSKKALSFPEKVVPLHRIFANKPIN